MGLRYHTKIIKRRTLPREIFGTLYPENRDRDDNTVHLSYECIIPISKRERELPGIKEEFFISTRWIYRLVLCTREHTGLVGASGNLEKFPLHLYPISIYYICTCVYTYNIYIYIKYTCRNGRTSKRRFEHALHTSVPRVYLTSLVPQNYPLKGRRYSG